MSIITFTTATTADGDWDGHMIEVQDAYWDTYIVADGQLNFQEVYNNGLAQGLITVVEQP
jgi:hypothetical protein